MKDGPALYLSVWTLHKDDGTTHRVLKLGQKQISKYVDAVNFLLKLYATEFHITRVIPMTAPLR